MSLAFIIPITERSEAKSCFLKASRLVLKLIPTQPHRKERSIMGKKDEALISVLDPKGQPSGVFGRSLEAGSAVMGGILNPFVQPTTSLESMEGLRMAPRLESLEGKVVYLVDTGFHGARDFMEEAEGWFSRNMPEVKIEVRSTQGGMFTDDPSLWAEIEEKGDAAVIGVGG